MISINFVELQAYRGRIGKRSTLFMRNLYKITFNIQVYLHTSGDFACSLYITTIIKEIGYIELSDLVALKVLLNPIHKTLTLNYL